MITRIVRMEFQTGQLATFFSLFDKSKEKIRTFEGCHHLELYQDLDHTNVLYTYSLWESQDALDAYRESPLFREIWPKTKALFAGKPSAFSLIHLQTVGDESM